MKGHAETQTPNTRPDSADYAFDPTLDYLSPEEWRQRVPEQQVAPKPYDSLASFVLLVTLSDRMTDRFVAWRKTEPLKRMLAAMKTARAEYKEVKEAAKAEYEADLARDDLPRSEIVSTAAWYSESGPVTGPFEAGIEGTTTTYQSQHARETQPQPVEHVHIGSLQEIDDETADLMQMAAQRARKALEAETQQPTGERTADEPTESQPQTYIPHMVRRERRRPTRYKRGISSRFRIAGAPYKGRHRTPDSNEAKNPQDDLSLAA